MIRRVLLGTAVAMSLTLLVGCGGSGNPKTYAVSGKVMFRGKPCDGALVVFHPTAKGRENDPKPVATVAEDGTYKLTTFEANDGAPEGDYGVTIVWNEKAKDKKFSLTGEGATGADKFAGRYGDPRNPKQKASVKSSGTNQFDFNLE